MIISKDYTLFKRFIETYLPSGFKNINPNDSVMQDLERMMEANDQFFYIGDLVLLKILYISQRVTKKMGVELEMIDPGFFITTTHPDDMRRHHLARAKLISLGQELYVNREGNGYMSFDVRTKKPDGGYYHMLYQWYYFYSEVPYDTVFLIVVFTDISKFGMPKIGSHHFSGNDSSNFRYPDNNLLELGNIFSPCEFRILQLIELGFSTQQIADKLNRSAHTIETHRGNIISKSDKASIMEVIHDLKQKGLM